MRKFQSKVLKVDELCYKMGSVGEERVQWSREFQSDIVSCQRRRNFDTENISLLYSSAAWDGNSYYCSG